MKTAIATIRGISPLGQNKFIQSEKLNKETSDAHDLRCWRERMHYDKDGNVFIPPMAFKNCLAECAKFLSIQIAGKGKSTYTKHFKAGVLVTDPLMLPYKMDDVPFELLPVPVDGVAGGGKRVFKHFPVIHEWGGDVVFHILDDTITEDVFKKVLVESGKFIGIGRFRPINGGFYGRFAVENVEWQEEEVEEAAQLSRVKPSGVERNQAQPNGAKWNKTMYS